MFDDGGVMRDDVAEICMKLDEVLPSPDMATGANDTIEQAAA
jgi:hypothetical protein